MTTIQERTPLMNIVDSYTASQARTFAEQNGFHPLTLETTLNRPLLFVWPESLRDYIHPDANPPALPNFVILERVTALKPGIRNEIYLDYMGEEAYFSMIVIPGVNSFISHLGSAQTPQGRVRTRRALLNYCYTLPSSVPDTLFPKRKKP